jgi:hypothetical protein
MSGQLSFKSPINLNIPLTPVTTTPDLYRDLALVYNALHTLQQGITLLTGAEQADPGVWAMTPIKSTLLCGNMNRVYMQASENIAYGQQISLVNVAGSVQFALADASNLALPSAGFCTTESGIAANNWGECMLGEGLLQGLAGLTIGERYWLGLTPGTITLVKPTGAGELGQFIGTAMSASELYVRIGPALAGNIAQH